MGWYRKLGFSDSSLQKITEQLDGASLKQMIQTLQTLQKVVFLISAKTREIHIGYKDYCIANYYEKLCFCTKLQTSQFTKKRYS